MSLATENLGNWGGGIGPAVSKHGIMTDLFCTVETLEKTLWRFHRPLDIGVNRLGVTDHVTPEDTSPTSKETFSENFQRGIGIEPQNITSYLKRHSSKEVPEHSASSHPYSLATGAAPERRKRGRPTKSRAAATPETKTRKPKQQCGTKGDAEHSCSANQRISRRRERNRIAADKCRSRRRQEENKLKSKREDLETENQQLSRMLFDLMAETYDLKNMLTAHGHCDCTLIQQYLQEAAINWLVGKMERSPVGGCE